MVHRGSLMEDAFRSLAHLGPALKARLSVTFVNEQGLRCGRSAATLSAFYVYPKDSEAII